MSDQQTRFAVLRHETPPNFRTETHWDLLLEREGALLSWSLVSEPRPGATIEATRLPDHRLSYLDYEGPVSENRGHVTRVGGGALQWLRYEETAIAVELRGAAANWRLELKHREHDSWTAAFTNSDR